MKNVEPAEVGTISLTEAERDDIVELAAGLSAIDPIAEVGRYVLAAQLLSGRMPERIRAELLPFRSDGSPRGGLLLRNLPTGSIPATPEHADEAVGVGLDGAKVMSIVAGLLGEQFGFQAELSGRIIQDILPVPGFEDTQQSISSRALLELHCETAFTEARADFVGLLCLRADEERQAATLLSSACDVLKLLSADTIRTLREPRFVTTVDGSFLRGSGLSGPITVGPISILTGSRARPRLRCDFAETTGVDSVGQRAVDDLYRAADAAARSIHLEPGDLLIVDNHSAFHGRTPFAMNETDSIGGCCECSLPATSRVRSLAGQRAGESLISTTGI